MTDIELLEKKFMCRYFVHLLNKIIRFIKFFIAKLTYTLLIFKKWNYRPIILYLVLVCFSTIFIVYNQPNKNLPWNDITESLLDNNEIIQCRFPQLLLNHKDLYFEVSRTIQPKCQSWFYPIKIENYHLRLILLNTHCNAIFYLGEGDRPYQKIEMKLIFNVSIPLLSDYFTIECDDPIKKTFYPKLPYASIHYNVNTRQRLENYKSKDEEDDFSILMLGLDSVSRLQFQRMLPQTYDYITKQLDAIVLQGYNILGDGTPQQLIPMLTGFKETELPSTLHRDRNGSFVDIYPFIWNQFRDNGYVTGYAEDRTEYGIFTLRLKGFAKTPTDHYLLPFYRMPTTKMLLHKREMRCIRNETTYEYFLSYIKQFWLSYPNNKKFYFGFFKQYTHDGYAVASLLDLTLLNFLKEFYLIDKNKKTIVILMTDHGARFSSARRTPQGKLEERLPLMTFIFPKLFQNKYPTAIKTLKKNIHRLTTPFDIYSTLLSLLNMSQTDSTKTYSSKQRNISLFNLIPAERTCEDINLEPHWCSCLQWNYLNITQTIIQQAIIHIMDYINKQLSMVENNLCQQLELVSINSAQSYQPNQALLRFSRSSDVDGRIPKYDDRKTDISFYQITFETKPNQGIYEATTQYSSRTNEFNTDLNHISRLNAYKSSASCIEKSYSHLRKFCQCIQ